MNLSRFKRLSIQRKIEQLDIDLTAIGREEGISAITGSKLLLRSYQKEYEQHLAIVRQSLPGYEPDPIDE